MRRGLSFALLLVLSSMTAAQSPKPRDSTGVMPLFSRFADIRGGWLVAAFDSIPAARYGFRPTPAEQSVGFMAQHLETANYGLCERLGVTHPRTAKDSLPDTVKALWPKDTLVARLEASLRFCDDALQRLGPLNSAPVASTLLGFETDLAEHYAQLSVYMRLLGLTPPSALPTKQRTAISLPETALRQFVGRYELNPNWQLIVETSDGALTIQSSIIGGPVRLWPETATDFFVKEIDAQVTFIRGSNGAVTGLVLHQFNRNRTATKLP